VPDPYSSTGGKIVVTSSIRDDPLGRLHARKHIDDAQHRIGLFLRELFELAEIGSIQALASPKPKKDEGVSVGASVSQELAAQLRDQAKHRGVTVSAIIVSAITEYLSKV
jgi:hypothetical protein